MLTVNKNSYVTVADADTYIAEHYRSNDKERIRWQEISEEDKEILLINACEKLEKLPWRGVKVTRNQILSFPRLPYQYGRTQEGAPINIKKAQIEIALWLSNGELQEEIIKRENLKSQGITSFSIGDLSESYKEGQNTSPVFPPRILSLITPYLNGGYDIC